LGLRARTQPRAEVGADSAIGLLPCDSTPIENAHIYANKRAVQLVSCCAKARPQDNEQSHTHMGRPMPRGRIYTRGEATRGGDEQYHTHGQTAAPRTHQRTGRGHPRGRRTMPHTRADRRPRDAPTYGARPPAGATNKPHTRADRRPGLSYRAGRSHPRGNRQSHIQRGLEHAGLTGSRSAQASNPVHGRFKMPQPQLQRAPRQQPT